MLWLIGAPVLSGKYHVIGETIQIPKITKSFPEHKFQRIGKIFGV